LAWHLLGKRKIIMDNTDDVIRELAKTHGREDLSDNELKDVKTRISTSYIDDILDATPTVTENTDAPKEENNGL